MKNIFENSNEKLEKIIYEKLDSINASKKEREKAEKDNKIAELQEKLALFQIEKNKSELKSVLSARGLSAEFADVVFIGDDIEEAQANIDKLDRLFKAAVRAEVEKRLAGNAPKGNGSSASAEMTKAEFMKLPISEQQKLYITNKELVDKFLND